MQRYSKSSIDTSDLKYLTCEDRAAIERYTISSEDVYISIAGTIGLVGIVPKELDGANLTENAAKILINNSDELNKNYLVYYLASIIGQQEIAARVAKTSQPKLAISRIEQIQLAYPPLTEQLVISHVLHAVQRARDTRLRESDLERERKAALMEHLFTHGTKGEPTKQTEIGEMPESWKIIKFGDALVSTQYGLSVRGNPEGSYPILRMNCLVDGHVNDSNLQYIELDKEDFENFRLDKGDILFNRTNSSDLVGKTGIFNRNGDFVFASYLIRLAVDKNKLSSEYINYYLNMNSSQTRLRLLASGGVSQSNINATKLKGFLIPLPPYAEQKIIAESLKACDNSIFALDRETHLLDELFQAMLEELMTGRLPTANLIEATAKA